MYILLMIDCVDKTPTTHQPGPCWTLAKDRPDQVTQALNTDKTEQYDIGAAIRQTVTDPTPSQGQSQSSWPCASSNGCHNHVPFAGWEEHWQYKGGREKKAVQCALLSAWAARLNSRPQDGDDARVQNEPQSILKALRLSGAVAQAS